MTNISEVEYAHIVCSDLFDMGFASRHHELLSSENLYTSGTCV